MLYHSNRIRRQRGNSYVLDIEKRGCDSPGEGNERGAASGMLCPRSSAGEHQASIPASKGDGQ